jgi:HPt (histidine-containing phosphotransfer) domain-containing protein
VLLRRWEKAMSDPLYIIRMALEAGCVPASHPMNPWSISQEQLEKFAELVVGHKVMRLEDERSNLLNVMQQALDALEYINTHCFIVADHEGPLERAIPALRKALAAGALDRLAQADRELGLGERSDG